MLFNRIKSIIKSNINFKNEDFSEDIDLNKVEDLYFDDANDDIKDNTEEKYYSNLELPYGANFDEIKKAYKKLLKKYHPDLYINDKKKYEVAVKLTAKINEAYTYFEGKYL